jgi:peptidoglycan/LPS O-acetylase OafA/YrhL
MPKDTRVNILDSFRFLAILSVMLFHYYSRWGSSLQRAIFFYPYGNSCDFFHFGYTGVDLFFILSSFLMINSLAGAKNLRIFWIKKLIRLFPPLFICSLITFLVFRY